MTNAPLQKLKLSAKRVHASLTGAPTETNQQHWQPSPESQQAPYVPVHTPFGPVLSMPQRAADNQGNYPPPQTGPRVPHNKKPLPRNQLQHLQTGPADPHPTRWNFPNYLDNPNCKWLTVLKEMYNNPLSFPASLSPEAGLLVHALVRNIRPKRIIETGTFIGMSTLWIASALHENNDGGIIHTFDNFGPIEKGPWRDAELKENRLEFVASILAKAGLADRVRLHVGNSSFELRATHKELQQAGGVELAFLDADHGITGVQQDFYATEPVLKTGGFILFHDTFPEMCGGHEGPRHLLDNINNTAQGLYEKTDLYLGPLNYGLGLLRRLA